MVLVLGAALYACSPITPASEVQPHAECVAGGAGSTDLLVVAVPGLVSPGNAPVPAGPAERMVFRQLYETLVRVDCTGRVIPGLAATWTVDDTGHVWQFTIRPDARFWDGSAVTAQDVVASWTTPRTSPAAAMITRVTALAERDVRIELRDAAATAHPFADPDLAIARYGASWAIGSGAFQPTEQGGSGSVQLRRVVDVPGTVQAIEFRSMASADARRALDAGADVIITGDPAAVQYARALGGYAAHALPWNRTYVLATRSPMASGEAATAGTAAADILPAVRADARHAAAPFWWESVQCRAKLQRQPPGQAERSVGGAVTGAAPRAHQAASAIAFPQGDAVARDIAERIAALAWPVSRTPAWLDPLLRARRTTEPPVTTAHSPMILADMMRSGAGLAFVLALSRTWYGCPAADRDEVLLQLLDGTTEWRITPLVDAREQVLSREGTGRFVIDGDGVPVFAGVR